MRVRFLALIIVAAVVLGTVATLLYWRSRIAELTGRDLLLRALTEGQRVPHEGRQAVRGRPGVPGAGGTEVVDTARILNAGDGRTRIEYLTGSVAGGTVWTDGRRVWRLHADGKRVTVSAARGTDPAQDELRRRLILQNYSPIAVGSDRVTGRRARIVDLRPRQPGRPWKRLWIDLERAVVLASRDFDAEGRPLRSMRFEEFHLLPAPPPPDDPRFLPPADLRARAANRRPASAGPFSAAELGKRAGFAVPQPGYLPAGFAWAGGYLDPCDCPTCDQTLVRMEFTDGLNALLVLACDHHCDGERSCLEHGDADPRFRRRVGKVTCMALGELPGGELQRVLDSLGKG